MFNPFGKKSYVGIDIGHYSIKLAQVDRAGNGWRVSKLFTMRTPQDAVRDSIVVDTEAVGMAIKQGLRQGGINANSAMIGVSGGSVIVRPVRIPKMAEATLRKSIKFEAGRYVPSSAEDSYIEFEIIGETEDNQMDVLMVAAPKDVVESRLKACDMAGLDVEIVDVEPFAVYRSLVECDPDSEMKPKTIVLIDVGGSTTSMSIVSDGVFAMARSLPQGGQTFTEALKNYFKLSEEDAESGKAQLNIAELIETAPKENPPLRVVQPHLDDMIREVRRSLNYFQSQAAEVGGTAHKNVDMVVLCGGGSKMQGLAEYMSHKLGIPTVALGVFSGDRFVGPSADSEVGQELAVVTGLAMRAA